MSCPEKHISRHIKLMPRNIRREWSGKYTQRVTSTLVHRTSNEQTTIQLQKMIKRNQNNNFRFTAFVIAKIRMCVSNSIRWMPFVFLSVPHQFVHCFNRAHSKYPQVETFATMQKKICHKIKCAKKSHLLVVWQRSFTTILQCSATSLFMIFSSFVFC